MLQRIHPLPIYTRSLTRPETSRYPSSSDSLTSCICCRLCNRLPRSSRHAAIACWTFDSICDGDVCRWMNKTNRIIITIKLRQNGATQRSVGSKRRMNVPMLLRDVIWPDDPRGRRAIGSRAPPGNPGNGPTGRAPGMDGDWCGSGDVGLMLFVRTEESGATSGVLGLDIDDGPACASETPGFDGSPFVGWFANLRFQVWSCVESDESGRCVVGRTGLLPSVGTAGSSRSLPGWLVVVEPAITGGICVGPLGCKSERSFSASRACS